MAILGKILGTAAGYALAGPLGAIVGIAIGHAADKKRRGRKRIGNQRHFHQTSRQNIETAFAIAFVTIAAKLSKADGRVTRDEIKVLRRVLVVHKNATDEMSVIFDAAKSDASGFEPYAQQIAAMVHFDPIMLEQILAGLAQIAAADGNYHSGEREFINAVAAEFGFTPAQLQRIEHTYMRITESGASNPYEILDVEHNASNEDIRAAYIKIIKEFHPDRLASKGLPEEFRKLGAKKTTEANVAYDQIKKERGIS